MKFTLRDDQVKTINETLTLLENPIAHPLIHTCVSGGKTSAIASTLIDEHFIKEMQDNDVVVFLVHTEVLARQAYETFKKTLHNLNYEVGIIGGTKFKSFQNFKAKVQVAMKDTFKNNIEKYKNEFGWVIKYAIVDEMHNCGAKGYKALLEYLIKTDKARCIGLSATPERHDAQATYPFRQEWTVTGLQNHQAIDLKVQAPYRLYAPQLYDATNAKIRGEDYDLQAMSIEEQSKGDASILYNPDLKKAFGLLPADLQLKGLVFCIDTDHIHSILNNLAHNGYSAAAITGTMNAEEKDVVLNELQTGKIQFLVTCNVLNEGFDLPSVNVLVSLRPTMSLKIYLQQYGRGARYMEGKINHIFDIAGNHKELGLPDDERMWTVRTMQLKYKKGSPSERKSWTMVCEGCYVVIPVIKLTCPHCGHLNIAKEQRYSQEELVLVKESAESKMKAIREIVVAKAQKQADVFQQNVDFLKDLQQDMPSDKECEEVFKSIATREFYQECFVKALHYHIKDKTKHDTLIKMMYEAVSKWNETSSDRIFNLDVKRLLQYCLAIVNDDNAIVEIMEQYNPYFAPYDITFKTTDANYYKTILENTISNYLLPLLERTQKYYETKSMLILDDSKKRSIITLKDNETNETITMGIAIANPFLIYAPWNKDAVYLFDINDGREVKLLLDGTNVEPTDITKSHNSGDFYIKHNKKKFVIPQKDFANFISTNGFSYVNNSKYSFVISAD